MVMHGRPEYAFASIRVSAYLLLQLIAVYLQDDSVELATSSDEEDSANPVADSLAKPSARQSEVNNSTDARPTATRKRHRAPASSDDPDQATSVRVRHNDHQHASTAAAPLSVRPTIRSVPEAVAQDLAQADADQDPAANQAAAAEEGAASAALEGAASAAVSTPGSVSQNRAFAVPRPQAGTAARPTASQDTAANAPAASASSQQGDCMGPDGKFIGRAAAAGLPPNIMRQTRAALGLWEQLHETASTPSTVLAPVNRHLAARTVSVGTDNSAA